MTTTRRELPPRYDAAGVEPAIYERWLASGAFTPAGRAAARRRARSSSPCRRPTSPARCTPGTPLVRDGRGHAHPLPPHARRRHAVGARASTTPASPPSSCSTRSSPRRGRRERRSGASATSSGCGSSWTRPATTISLQHRRLGASADWTRDRVHHGRRAARGRCGSPSSGCGTRASCTGARRWSTGARAAGPRSATSRTSIATRPARCGRSATTSARADGTPDPDAWISDRHHAPGDPARRHRRGGASRRRAVPVAGRARGHPARSSGVACRSSPTRRSTATFGTGAVKITPAHDLDDYEIGASATACRRSSSSTRRRASTRRAATSPACDRYEARAADRGPARGDGRPRGASGRTRWWSGTATAAARSSSRASRSSGSSAPSRSPSERWHRSARGGPGSCPTHFEKVYAHWMENIHDWAVGRQLWWGHRIPAWFCPDGHITVSDAPRRARCLRDLRPPGRRADPGDRHLRHLVQQRAVAVLAPWAGRTTPPTCAASTRPSVMETGYDILFFWVARMMMLGLFCTDVEPFHTVYLHGLVRARAA